MKSHHLDGLIGKTSKEEGENAYTDGGKISQAGM